MTKHAPSFPEKLSFSVEPETRAAIEAAAEQERRPLSNMLRQLIADGLKARAAERGQVAA